MREEHRLILETIENALEFTKDLYPLHFTNSSFCSSPPFPSSFNFISNSKDSASHDHDCENLNNAEEEISNFHSIDDYMESHDYNHSNHNHILYNSYNHDNHILYNQNDLHSPCSIEKSMFENKHFHNADSEMTLGNMSLSSQDYLFRYGLLKSGKKKEIKNRENINNSFPHPSSQNSPLLAIKSDDYYILNGSEFHQIRQHLHEKNLNNRNLFI